ncbi:trypsin-like peptidase domain-containing protein [Nocardioides sp. AX2bis]|uniref:trypsin-like peptidase domain-containing protein n=1 Tax=Nocardioides sp. AX2bis TaxID=2653157 RepID=UPI0012F36EC9|nr:trypsin-like peptidase domain-containing protein [Nocardioides sp. AX2bis]VXB44375.1 conserved hypothetical protein [Nocardioides sp. AX2bis]
MLQVSLPSVQSLRVFMTVRDQVLSSGTAFLIEEGGTTFLVTNRHNLSGRRSDTDEVLSKTAATPDSVTVLHNSDSGPGHWVVVKEPLLDQDGRPLWLEHPVHGGLVDVVALPLTQLAGVSTFPYAFDELAIQLPRHITLDLYVVGYPFGQGSLGDSAAHGVALWTRGTIASEWTLDHSDLPRFLIDARTRPGQSGSPVIYYSPGGSLMLRDGTIGVANGEVVELFGCYSGRVNAESDLGVVWKTSAIEQVVHRGVRPAML